MNWLTRRLMYTQLDDKIKVLKDCPVPKIGWLKTIRTVLGMSSKQLAKRCGVTEQRIQRIEQDEVSKKTTLNTLDKVAHQLNCDLVYAFVPKTSISNIIEVQAEKKAMQKLDAVSHSMSLEDQRLTDEANRAQLEMLKKDLIEKHIKSIWE